MRKNEIVAWTEDWNKIYFLEEEILKGILKEELLTKANKWATQKN